MRFPPWDAMVPGSIDSIVLDFTADQQDSFSTVLAWTSELSPYADLTVVVDPAPATHVISSRILTSLPIRNPITNAVTYQSGCFAYAVVGQFPLTAVGGTYVLSATMTFQDARIVTKQGVILCSTEGHWTGVTPVSSPPPPQIPSTISLGNRSVYTLADGTTVGQQAWIEDNLGTAASVRPVIYGNFVSGSSITFVVNYQSVICLWNGMSWGLF